MKNFFRALPFFFFSLKIYGEPLYHIFESTRIQGFGGAGSSVVEGEEAIFYNPARINHGDRMKTVSIVSPQAAFGGAGVEFLVDRDRYSKLQFTETELVDLIQSENIYLSGQNHTGAVLDKSAFGILTRSYMDLQFSGDIELLDTLILDSNIYVYNAVYYGFSRELFKNFEAGILIKLVQKAEISLKEDMITLIELAIVDEDKNFLKYFQNTIGFGVGVDLGLNYTIPKEKHEFSFALVGQNVGGQRYFGSEPPHMDRTLLNFGTSYKRKLLEHEQEIIASLDFKDLLYFYNNDFGKKVHFGLMWKYKNFGSLSIGVSQGYPTAGLHLGSRIFDFELAAYAVELGKKSGHKPSPRISAMMHFGWNF